MSTKVLFTYMNRCRQCGAVPTWDGLIAFNRCERIRQERKVKKSA